MTPLKGWADLEPLLPEAPLTTFDDAYEDLLRLVS
jgi:hypothetical protein